ncbi:DUF5362 family protein [Flavobacterium phragmitis]|uniref:DUF5362 domain-containing protein n=1 Tax=Flavobacterium phragmitis TaxID=739143 RepID=A0A1I1UPH8_9FLAO|nr:DUF5362 family protein [Flavobacterium phragmitis]SFD71538.1 hypothetical protein SAMN05216297_11169 [Flavobacterium phragmitis]
MEETSAFEKFELQLDTTAKDFVKEIAKWAYFLSIIGFIGIGLLLIIAVFAGAIFSAMGSTMPGMGAYGGSFGAAMGAIYFLMAAFYFFPVYYLFKFSSNAKKAFRDNDSEALTSSFGYLKSHYKFIGILMIVLLAIYALFFLFAVLGGLMAR